MKESTRRAALRYAQKTALVVSMTGCYGSHGRIARAVEADAGRPVDAPLVADAPPPLPDVPPPLPDAPPLDCEALASLEITVPEPSDGWVWGATFTDPAVRADPAVGACCVDMDERAGADPATVEIGTALAMACCQVIVEEQRLVPFSNLGCTPWGPPCPPEMPQDGIA